MSDTRIIDLVVPRLGETMEEGAVRDWLKAVGDRFERGEAIVEIETDKTIAEVPAMLSGRLVEILAESGRTLDVGAVLARIEVAVDDAPDVPGIDEAAEAEGGDESAPRDRDAAAAAAAAAAADVGNGNGSTEAPASAPGASSPDGGRPVRATPAARRVARQAKLDVRGVTGTGRRGRVETRDVRQAVSENDPLDAPLMAVSSAATPVLQRVGDIAYVMNGPADGEPTLLLHGFAGDHGAWAALMQALVRGGRRVVAPDLPGHGATALEAANADQLAQRLEDVVGLCAGSRPCHLVAHSLGAAPALALAERISTASLTLLAPIGMGSTIDEEFVRGMASPGSAGEVAHLLRRLSDRGGVMSPAAIDALTVELSRGRLSELAGSLIGEIGQTLDLVPAIERAARRMAVRVIVGHRDRIIEWRDACRLSSRVAVHHFPEAGHVPQWDFAREVAEILVSPNR